jgi:hypothetical protein
MIHRSRHLADASFDRFRHRHQTSFRVGIGDMISCNRHQGCETTSVGEVIFPVHVQNLHLITVAFDQK